MKTSKWALFVICLVILAIVIFNNFISEQETKKSHPPPASRLQQPATVGSAALSRSLRHISVRMKKPLTTLIAGETGSFELEASLKAPQSLSEAPSLWQRNGETPLLIWIASPYESGIAFVDETIRIGPATIFW